MNRLEKRIIRLEKIIPYFICYWFFLIGGMIGISGGLLNVFVVSVNNGRMPVLTNYSLNTSSHFNYLNDSEVRKAIFTDRIHILNTFWSIGDVFIILGAFFLSIFIFINLKLIVKKWKERYNSQTKKR